MSRYSVRRHPNEQHIGDSDGRIALWLNETSAHDLAAMFPWPDLGGSEILEAIERAYPADSQPYTTQARTIDPLEALRADSQEDKT